MSEERWTASASSRHGSECIAEGRVQPAGHVVHEMSSATIIRTACGQYRRCLEGRSMSGRAQRRKGRQRPAVMYEQSGNAAGTCITAHDSFPSIR
jgi:hypothetical protein